MEGLLVCKGSGLLPAPAVREALDLAGEQCRGILIARSQTGPDTLRDIREGPRRPLVILQLYPNDLPEQGPDEAWLQSLRPFDGCVDGISISLRGDNAVLDPGRLRPYLDALRAELPELRLAASGIITTLSHLAMHRADPELAFISAKLTRREGPDLYAAQQLVAQAHILFGVEEDDEE